MHISEIEFLNLSKKLCLDWKPIIDSKIKKDKHYFISDNLIVRHGPLGSSYHDLKNLEWGSHEDNMDNIKIDREQAVAFFVLANMEIDHRMEFTVPECLDDRCPLTQSTGICADAY